MRNLGLAVLMLTISGTAIAQAPGQTAILDLPAPTQVVPVVVPAAAGFGGVQDPLLGGVPSGKPTPGVLPLSLSDALQRGLNYNLGALLSAEQVRAVRGARLLALSRLLPQVSAGVSEQQQQVNLAAFGFQGFPGVRSVVGPFNVFDVRAFVSQSVLDFSAINRYRAEKENTNAALLSNENTRDLVALVCANLYLQAAAGQSRIESTRAQVKTAQALYDLAVDQKAAGVVPGIEVLRAQVQLQAEQQRLIVAEDQYAKDKLALARAIRLPLGQEFSLTETMSFKQIPVMSLEDALQRAYRDRPDFKGAQSRVKAAELDRKAATAQRLPRVDFNADYGDIGRRPWSSHGTFLVATTLRVPIFQGGSIRGLILEADAALRQRQAELEDTRGRVYYDVRNAFLDLQSAADRVKVAQSAVALANEQVLQSEDRFRAGVTNNVEVVQAQEAVATANENYISSLQAHIAAKLALARAIGVSDTEYEQFVRGN